MPNPWEIAQQLWQGFNNNPDNAETFDTLANFNPIAAAYRGAKTLYFAPSPSQVYSGKASAVDAASDYLSGGLDLLPMAGPLGKLGKLTGRLAAAGIHEGMMGAGPLSYLNYFAPQVIKPRGGNWLTGEGSGVAGLLRNLQQQPVGHGPGVNTYRYDDLLANYGITGQDFEKLPELYRQKLASDYIEKINAPITVTNKWIEGPLRKYIIRDMATPEDPIRKLAEQGILHYDPSPLSSFGVNTARSLRTEAGFPEYGVASSPVAKSWEDTVDQLLSPGKRREWGAAFPKDAQWMKDLPQDTVIHDISPRQDIVSKLGFDHLMDVIRDDLQTGKLRPEQLTSGNFSVEAAVRRAHEYNQEKAAAMAQARTAAMEGLPIHKDYGDGMRWVELKHPTDDAVTAQVLKDEGDSMGHCVGSYCPSVLSGETRILSLRDKSGMPHTTVEIRPPDVRRLKNSPSTFWSEHAPEEFKQRYPLTDDTDISWSRGVGQSSEYRDWMASLPPEIVQIKGKQNAAPVEKYLPYVQDLVKSGKWSEVGDLGSTGLYDATRSNDLIDFIMHSNPEATRNDRLLAINRAKAAGAFENLPRWMTREDWETAITPHLPEKASGGLVEHIRSLL